MNLEPERPDVSPEKKETNVSSAIQSLSPLQYSYHMAKQNGLELPDPFLPELKQGDYEILHVLHKQGEKLQLVDHRTALFSGIPASSKDLPGDWIEMVLNENGSRIRSTYPIEVVQQTYAVDHAHGDVLISGIGIGLTAWSLRKNSKVNSVTCVEESADLIKIMSAYFPEVAFVTGDIITFVNDPKSGKYDFIYFDAGNDSIGSFYHKVAPFKNHAHQVLSSTSGVDEIVCWNEEVMHGQIIMNIMSSIHTQFDISKESQDRIDHMREYMAIEVDFFLKHGVVKSNDKTFSTVEAFVKSWKMKDP